jgi:hypothetical protein
MDSADQLYARAERYRHMATTFYNEKGRVALRAIGPCRRTGGQGGVTDRAPAAYDPKRRNGELISDGQAPRELYRDRGLPQIRRSTRRWTTRAQDEIYRSTRVIAITATSVRIPAKVRASVSRVNGLPHTRPAGWPYT